MADYDSLISSLGSASNVLMGASSVALQNRLDRANRKENQRIRAENRDWALEDYERIKADNLSNYQMQRDDNIAFWNMENEYNSPDAQRRRLEEAGYNPQLALGDINTVSKAGDVNSASMAEAPGIDSNPQGAYQSPMRDYSSMSGMVSSAVQSYGAMQSIRGMQLDNDLKAETLPWSSKQRRNESEASNYLGRQAEISLILDEARVEYTNQLARYQSELSQLTASQKTATDQSVTESEARVTNLSSQTALNEQMSSESQSRQGEIATRIRFLNTQIATLQKDLQYVDDLKRTQINQQLANTKLSEKQTKVAGRQPSPYWTVDDGDDSTVGPKNSWDGFGQWLGGILHIGAH